MRARPRASLPGPSAPAPRLRQAAIEKRARGELTAVAVEKLELLGLLGAVDEAAARAELRELEASLDALEELQSWVEAELGAATAA
ncbi:MAG: hypothetical protein QOG06_2155 [Gaiellaceae bacterium]|nr:hypothetical protein [Gaiellaceae bacterium]